MSFGRSDLIAKWNEPPDAWVRLLTLQGSSAEVTFPKPTVVWVLVKAEDTPYLGPGSETLYGGHCWEYFSTDLTPLAHVCGSWVDPRNVPSFPAIH